MARNSHFFYADKTENSGIKKRPDFSDLFYSLD